MQPRRVVLGDPAREPLEVPLDLHMKLKQGVSINQKVDVLYAGGSEVEVGKGGSGVWCLPSHTKKTQISQPCLPPPLSHQSSQTS